MPLFHRTTKNVAFYYYGVNSIEVKSVARCLPLFIRDIFKLKPAFFCSSYFLTEALMGSWNFNKFIFMTKEDKIEFEILEEMEEKMNVNIYLKGEPEIPGIKKIRNF